MGEVNEPTGLERTLYRAALLLEDEERVFTGTHWPVLVTRVAMKWNAPGLVRVFEAGFINDTLPDRLLTSIAEYQPYHRRGVFAGSTIESLYGLLGRGYISSAVLDAPTVDRFGNVNSTAIGDYDHPTVRLPGSGGATEMSAFANRLILVNGSSDPRRYPREVDYVSSPGYLDEGISRQEAGYPADTGPTYLVSPFGLFSFPLETDHVRLEEHFPPYTPGDIRKTLDWPLETSHAERFVTEQPLGRRVVREVKQEARQRHYRIPE